MDALTHAMLIAVTLCVRTEVAKMMIALGTWFASVRQGMPEASSAAQSQNRYQRQKLLRSKSFRSGTQSIIETGLGRQGVHKRDAEHMVYGRFSFRS